MNLPASPVGIKEKMQKPLRLKPLGQGLQPKFWTIKVMQNTHGINVIKMSCALKI